MPRPAGVRLHTCGGPQADGGRGRRCGGRSNPHNAVYRSDPTLTSVLCCSDAATDEDWLPLSYLPKREFKTRWATGTDAFRHLVDGVVGWALTHYKSSLRVGSSFSFVACRADQVSNIVAHCCAEIGDAVVVLETELSEIQITFALDGYLHVGIVLDPGKLSSAVDEQIQLLAGLAPILDYAFMTRANNATTTLTSLLGGMPRYLSLEVAKVPIQDHAALKRSLLDIFGVQFLGPGHSDLEPQEAWKTWNLGHGRRLVGLRELSGWFAAGGPPMEKLSELRKQNAEQFLVKFAAHPASWGPFQP